MKACCLLIASIEVLILVTLPPYPWDQPLAGPNVMIYAFIFAFLLSATYFSGSRAINIHQRQFTQEGT